MVFKVIFLNKVNFFNKHFYTWNTVYSLHSFFFSRGGAKPIHGIQKGTNNLLLKNIYFKQVLQKPFIPGNKKNFISENYVSLWDWSACEWRSRVGWCVTDTFHTATQITLVWAKKTSLHHYICWTDCCTLASFQGTVYNFREK